MRIPTRYDVDGMQRSGPMYVAWVRGLGMLPEIAEQWRWEETAWMGNATRPTFGLLLDIGPEPMPMRPLATVTR